jgi:hypothetical protein
LLKTPHKSLSPLFSGSSIIWATHMVSRRGFFWVLLASGVCLASTVAQAEDDGGNSNSGSGGSGGSGSGSSGSGSSGSGSNGSGSGSSGSGSSGSGSSGSGSSGSSGDDDEDLDDDDARAARDAVKRNKAAPLKEILAIVKTKYDGEVVHVSLRGSGSDLTYRIKLLDKTNRLFEVQVNAISRNITLTKGL